MEVKPLLIMPSDLLTPKEKKSIEDAGYLLVISDEPEKIKFLHPEGYKEKMYNALLNVVFNSRTGTTAYEMREWLCRLLLNDAGAQSTK